MKPVEIYTTPICGFCRRAKALLQEKGVSFHEVNLLEEKDRRQEMMERSGRFTVPQIFIDGQSIGGCDELYALERAGKLDNMLRLE